MKVEEDEDTRRKKRLLPQVLEDLQALQNVYFELQTFQDEFSSRNQEIGSTCHIITKIHTNHNITTNSNLT